MKDDTSVIEDYLPIKAISAEASREKSVRKGHISTLHLWWARRPLVACRAAVYGALVPASRFVPENGPDNKKQSLGRANSAKFIDRLCKYPVNSSILKEAQSHILEAHAKRLTMETGKKVTVKDIEEGHAPHPKVLDLFAGGGAIPLEALRLGCEAYALDLNPVAHIIELCTLVYPQNYGKPNLMARGMTGTKDVKGNTTWGGLAEELRYWGKWVLQKAKAEIGDLYPPIPDPMYKRKRCEIELNEATGNWIARGTKEDTGTRRKDSLFDITDNHTLPPGYLQPVAYIWTRTVRCKNPSCGAIVPLVRQTWLCKKTGRYVALKMIALTGSKRVSFKVVESKNESGLGFDPAGFSKGGNTTCSYCGAVVDSQYIKAESSAGRFELQLMSIVCSRLGEKGKVYLSEGDIPQSSIPDHIIIKKLTENVCVEMNLTEPSEPLVGKMTDQLPAYGMKTFSDVFTSRQILSLLVLTKGVLNAQKKMIETGLDSIKAKAVLTYLGLLVSRMANFNSSLCLWNYTGGRGVVHTFGRQALAMTWDFPESNPFNHLGANWEGGVESSISVIENLITQDISLNDSHVTRGSATRTSFASETVDAIITDPPYYDNICYADLSDFFYVWLRRCIGELYREHFATELSPKKEEAISSPYRFKNKQTARDFYENQMGEAFAEAYRLLKPVGSLVCVYAHKTTVGWATIVEALRRTGFIVTEAWPLDTERDAGFRIDKAMLSSSIFLVARKRDIEAGVGQYENIVQPELEMIVRERVDTLWDMGITGADLVIASVGAGLRAFTRYERVEYANGEEVPAEKFLTEVEGVVLDTMMAKLFGVSGGNVSSVDPESRFYVLWRFVYRTSEIDAGEAIVFTYSQHVELDSPHGLSVGKDALVEKKKGKYRIRDFTERGQHDKLGLPTDDGQPAPLIDVLHRVLWLIENSPRKVAEFLEEARPDRERLRVLAQTLSGAALSGKSEQDIERLVSTTPAEQTALGKLLANWRTLIESQLIKTEGRLL